jgi:hypothetical protein
MHMAIASALTMWNNQLASKVSEPVEIDSRS